MRAGERRSDNSDDEIWPAHVAVPRPARCRLCLQHSSSARGRKGGGHCPLWALADILRCDSDVCFTPESGYVRCLRDARFGPIARHSVDDPVGAGEKRRRHGEAERLGGPEIDHQVVFGRRLDRQVYGLLSP
jgi:hypothetical protein